MSDVAFMDEAGAVDQAAEMADVLLSKVYRGPGDTVEAAMHRAEQTYGIPRETFWALRYRRPKAMMVYAWHQLKSVYDATCAAQEARLRHELEITRQLPATQARRALIEEVEALLGPADREVVPTPVDPPPPRIAG